MKLNWALLFAVIVTMVSSCKDDSTEPAVIASYTYTVSATDFKTVTFTNAAQNFSTLSWDFGDGSAVSAETNPTHTFPAVGEYTVKLTATSPGGVTDVYGEKITIADPNELLTMLVGDASKTWKLLRQTTSGRYPLEVGPSDHSQIWWAMGRDNDEIANRPCMMNDEWIFSRDGLKMKFDAKGDYWAEQGIFAEPSNYCASTADPMIGKNGENLSAWGGGDFTFVLTAGSPTKLTVNGLGAFVGFIKLGDGIEVSATNPIVVPSTLTYDVVKLYDGTVDTLVIEGPYSGAPGYWRFTLVHYDNPADEPQVAGPKPVANFSYTLSGTTISCTNTSTNGTSYAWDFGDGGTSAEMNPTHTYAVDGIYIVTLTATNPQGTSTATKTVATSVLTEATLLGTWKLQVSANSVFVGPGLGSNGWWICPLANLDGTNVGTADDWSCMADDEFIFSAGGVFEFKTMGSTRNDGYFGSPNGCWSDAEIAASPGAPFGSAHHTFAFTAADVSPSGRPIITLTNGDAGKVGFLGFYKGYYGGENTDNTKPANGGFATNKYEVMAYGHTGGKEIMVVSVDLTPDHNGGSAWTMTLER